MLTIRPVSQRDWNAIWSIIAPVFRAGETYPFSPDITESDAHGIWMEIPVATYVAVDDDDTILGTYYMKPNQPALGSHVCNCGYIVAKTAQGQGIASRMCQHSQKEAVSKGFRAMQYNLVVSTNERAVRLWKKHGFTIVGILPAAFRHRKLGFVDALLMYKQLST